MRWNILRLLVALRLGALGGKRCQSPSVIVSSTVKIGDVAVSSAVLRAVASVARDLSRSFCVFCIACVACCPAAATPAAPEPPCDPVLVTYWSTSSSASSGQMQLVPVQLSMVSVKLSHIDSSHAPQLASAGWPSRPTPHRSLRVRGPPLVPTAG